MVLGVSIKWNLYSRISEFRTECGRRVSDGVELEERKRHILFFDNNRRPLEPIRKIMKWN